MVLEQRLGPFASNGEIAFIDSYFPPERVAMIKDKEDVRRAMDWIDARKKLRCLSYSDADLLITRVNPEKLNTIRVEEDLLKALKTCRQLVYEKSMLRNE
jgi:hypothetical protein